LSLTFNWLRSYRCDALYLASGPLGPAKRAEIIALAAESRIPEIYSYQVFAVAGGLIAHCSRALVLHRGRGKVFDDLEPAIAIYSDL